jgi:predicted permease
VRQFGGDDCNEIGRSLTIDGTAFEVIGVLPSGHRFPGIQYRSPAPDVWIPLIPRPDEQRVILKTLRAVGRMAPGATEESVAADLDTIVARLAAQDSLFTGWHARVQLLSESISGHLRTPLYVAFLAALLLLATACVNAVSLMVARHLGALPERAVRYALGASPVALLRYWLIENSLLMLVGLGGGILLAQLTLMSFRATSGDTLGEGVELSLEWGTLFFALALAAAAVIFTTLASWSATRRLPLAPYLKEASKGSAGGPRSSRALTIVVAVEFGIACALLAVGATVFAQLQRLQSTSPGFEAQHAWAAVFNLPPRQYPSQEEQRSFLEALEREVDSAAGIDAVGAVARAPMIPGFPTVTFTIEGNVLPPGQQPDAHYRPMSPTYFDALGIKMREGRSFEEADALQGGLVCVVSETLARQQWPDQSAIGKRLWLVNETERLRTVVGVVPDAHIVSLDEASENVIYVPLAQNTWPNLLATNALVSRSRLDEPRLARLVKDALRRVDPTLPAPQLENLEEASLGSVTKRRFLSSLIFAFASIAALLAVFGVYGAFDYAAASHVRELAIRRALGATHRRLLLESLGRSARILGAGLLIGLGAGWLLMRLAQSFLLGWSMTEAATVALATIALLIVAGGASCLPTHTMARRSIAAVIREAA